MFSTSGDVQYIGGVQYIGDVHYIGRCSVPWGGTMSTSGDFMSTSGDIMNTSGGGTMMHVREQCDKSLSIYIDNPDILNIPDVLIISPNAS